MIQNGKVLKQGNSEFNSDQAGTVLIKSNAKLSDEKKYVITYVATKELEERVEISCKYLLNLNWNRYLLPASNFIGPKQRALECFQRAQLESRVDLNP